VGRDFCARKEKWTSCLWVKALFYRIAPLLGNWAGVVSCLAGCRMIESFEVENFRCFESLKLGGLKRVNIITGENASGKTALLEAIFAATRGNVEGLVVLNQIRGITIGNNPIFSGLPMIVPTQHFSALWDHLFYSSRAANEIAFRFRDSDNTAYSLNVSFGVEGQHIVPQSLGGAGAGIAPLVISRTVAKSGEPAIDTSGIVSLGMQGVLQASAQLPNLGPSVFIFTAALNYAETDNVIWFSQLREKNATEGIVGFFQKNFTFIKNLEVLASSGTPGIYATLSSGEVRRLQIVSSGIYKIVSILLACAHANNGVILIDEIENGIFYEKYELTWSILNKFSKDYDCQVFVSSHSAECLQKLVQVIGDDVDEFSLIRTERKNGKCETRHISGASMKAALKRGGEIRGASVGSADQNH
jgi:hypothetical protein